VHAANPAAAEDSETDHALILTYRGPNAIEEGGDFGCGAIRVLSMREMADVVEDRVIKIGERLA
jgi:hypothetical protein